MQRVNSHYFLVLAVDKSGPQAYVVIEFAGLKKLGGDMGIEASGSGGLRHFHSYYVGTGLQQTYDYNDDESLDTVNVFVRTYQGIRAFSGDSKSAWLVGPSLFWEGSVALAKFPGLGKTDTKGELQGNTHLAFGGALAIQVPGPAIMYLKTGVMSKNESEEFRDKDLVMTYGLGFDGGIKKFENGALSLGFDVSSDRYGISLNVGLGWFSF